MADDEDPDANDPSWAPDPRHADNDDNCASPMQVVDTDGEEIIEDTEKGKAIVSFWLACDSNSAQHLI